MALSDHLGWRGASSSGQNFFGEHKAFPQFWSPHPWDGSCLHSPWRESLWLFWPLVSASPLYRGVLFSWVQKIRISFFFSLSFPESLPRQTGKGYWESQDEAQVLEHLVPKWILVLNLYPTLSQCGFLWKPWKTETQIKHTFGVLSCCIENLCARSQWQATSPGSELPWDASWGTSHPAPPSRPGLWGPFPPSECSGFLPWERARVAPPEALFPGSTLCQQTPPASISVGRSSIWSLAERGSFLWGPATPSPSVLHKVQLGEAPSDF